MKFFVGILVGIILTLSFVINSNDKLLELLHLEKFKTTSSTVQEENNPISNSKVKIWVDSETQIEYLVYEKGGITPRIKVNN